MISVGNLLSQPIQALQERCNTVASTRIPRMSDEQSASSTKMTATPTCSEVAHVIAAERGEYDEFNYRIVCVCRTAEEAKDVILKLDADTRAAKDELKAWLKENPNPGGASATGFKEWCAAEDLKARNIAAKMIDPTIKPEEVSLAAMGSGETIYKAIAVAFAPILEAKEALAP